MAQQFRTGSIEITEAGRSADGLGQLLRVGLTLSDQDGEQPAAREHEAERYRRETAAHRERKRRIGMACMQRARHERERGSGHQDTERRDDYL